MIKPPWMRIPGYPDYAMNLHSADICRVTPPRNKPQGLALDADGTLPQAHWRTMAVFQESRRGMGHVELMPPGKDKGTRVSVSKLLDEMAELEVRQKKGLP